MSENKAVLAALARDLSAARRVDIGAYFTADFRLHDPNAGAWPVGHEGARKMVDGILAFAPDLHLKALDMVEEADQVAVRWRLTGTRDGAPSTASIVAIYRFEGGRIAEDWGIAARAGWP
jgi:predicted SnoaL-like aldol condensation-catalyzing enzyme